MVFGVTPEKHLSMDERLTMHSRWKITVGIVRLSPGVDGVDTVCVELAARVEHGAGKKGEHSAEIEMSANRFKICRK